MTRYPIARIRGPCCAHANNYHLNELWRCFVLDLTCCRCKHKCITQKVPEPFAHCFQSSSRAHTIIYGSILPEQNSKSFIVVRRKMVDSLIYTLLSRRYIYCISLNKEDAKSDNSSLHENRYRHGKAADQLRCIKSSFRPT